MNVLSKHVRSKNFDKIDFKVENNDPAYYEKIAHDMAKLEGDAVIYMMNHIEEFLK